MVLCVLGTIISITSAQKFTAHQACSTSSINQMDDSIAEYNYGDTVYGFAMAVCLDKKRIESGLPVWVSVKIKNVSDKTLKILEANPLRQFSFTIVNSENNIVSKLGYQTQLDNQPKESPRNFLKELKAGESETYHFNLSRRFDLTVIGKYTVQCERKVHRKNKDGKLEFQNLSSKKETFEIIPSSEDGQRIPIEQEEKTTTTAESAKK